MFRDGAPIPVERVAVAKERTIELGLHESGTGHGLGAALRPVLDRALALLGDAIQSGDAGSERRDAPSEFQRGRALLAEADDPNRIEAASRTLFAVCENALARISKQRSSRAAEIDSLVALVREALATIAGDNLAFDSNLDLTAARFEAMAQCSDLHEMKELLSAEVDVLKHIAAERQERWEATVSGFEGRVAMLEQQLVVTLHEASLDSLTGISNRRTFERTCTQWLDSRSQFVVALMDLDDFKQINDRHGHSVGDTVLVAVAEALKSSIRSSDLVVRFGGDEFAVLASDLTLRQAEGRMKVVAAQLAKASAVPGHEEGITVSCGIAEFSAGDTVDSLVHRADQALYEAKRRGKNRVAVKTPSFIRDLLRN